MAVARASGMAPSTVARAVKELEDGVEITDRVRRRGAGRKPLTETDPTLLTDLDGLVDPETRGDPGCLLRWTCKSTRQLADALQAMGHQVSHTVVGELLRRLGYSLQSTRKTREGVQHPDRDAQFGYIAAQAQGHVEAGEPVISVDAKKKELVGTFKNGGREWQPAGQPEQVNIYDFPGPDVGKAWPYGVYDPTTNTGWVGVGTDHNTASFAAQTIRRWWQMVGASAYPDASRLLVCADGGGSNGSRTRLWKVELARLAAETGLEITVCHYPPGTSKWNKVEHRLFSHISMNWRGKPLTSHQVIVDLIASTTTRTGLKVHAELDTTEYPIGIKVTDHEMEAVPLQRHEFHGNWNYSITPPQSTRGP